MGLVTIMLLGYVPVVIGGIVAEFLYHGKSTKRARIPGYAYMQTMEPGAIVVCGIVLWFAVVVLVLGVTGHMGQ